MVRQRDSAVYPPDASCLMRICEKSDPDVSEGCTGMIESPVSLELEVPPQDDAERLGSYQGKFWDGSQEVEI